MIEYTVGDSDRVEQSGVIPYLIENGDCKVMMVTNRSGKKWIFPKGYIEFGYSSQDSAAKEAYEESGVIGEVLEKPIGEYDYLKNGMIHNVTLYLMRIKQMKDLWPEKDLRKRILINYDDVHDYIFDKKLLKLLKKFKSNI